MTDLERLTLESNRLILLGLVQISDPNPITASMARKAEEIEMLLKSYDDAARRRRGDR